MSPATAVPPSTRSVAELQRSLRIRPGSGITDGLGWPHELVAAAPDGGGAAATLDRCRVVVIAAHSGAGASTVALAMADAVGQTGRTVHLIEVSEPMRSGLAAASHAELGVTPGGEWRRGRRGTSAIIDRPTVLASADCEPASSVESAVSIVDLGLPLWSSLSQLGGGRERLVVVGRATVPGVRATERALAELLDVVTAVAMIGPERWPGEVRASAGPKIRKLVDDGEVTSVPYSKRLDACGLDHRPLPSSVVRAGGDLFGRCAGGGLISGRGEKVTPR